MLDQNRTDLDQVTTVSNIDAGNLIDIYYRYAVLQSDVVRFRMFPPKLAITIRERKKINVASNN